MTFFDGKTALITGGAGSLGMALAKKLLETNIRTIRLLDVSEYFLSKATHELRSNPRIRLLLGDVRDRDRVAMALKGVDYVFHTAAVKSIDIAGFNPIEAIKVNVDGTINLIVSSVVEEGPERFLFVSSDKSVFVERQNIYAATKFLGEQLVSWANRIQDHTRFSSIRMGNLIESRMNVFEKWREEEAVGEPLSLTSPMMKRWFLSIEKGAEYMIEALKLMEGGEIFVAPAEEKLLIDLVGDRPYKIIGVREGERMREMLMSEEEQKNATLKGNLWVLKQ